MVSSSPQPMETTTGPFRARGRFDLRLITATGRLKSIFEGNVIDPRWKYKVEMIFPRGTVVLNDASHG